MFMCRLGGKQSLQKTCMMVSSLGQVVLALSCGGADEVV